MVAKRPISSPSDSTMRLRAPGSRELATPTMNWQEARSRAVEMGPNTGRPSMVLPCFDGSSSRKPSKFHRNSLSLIAPTTSAISRELPPAPTMMRSWAILYRSLALPPGYAGRLATLVSPRRRPKRRLMPLLAVLTLQDSPVQACHRGATACTRLAGVGVASRLRASLYGPPGASPGLASSP